MTAHGFGICSQRLSCAVQLHLCSHLQMSFAAAADQSKSSTASAYPAAQPAADDRDTPVQPMAAPANGSLSTAATTTHTSEATLVSQRVSPPTLPTHSGTYTFDNTGADTGAMPDAHAKLLCALENLASADPPRVFARRYVLLQERSVGGQAVVNYARGRDGGLYQYALKNELLIYIFLLKRVIFSTIALRIIACALVCLRVALGVQCKPRACRASTAAQDLTFTVKTR